MPNLTVKNIPVQVYEALRISARRHHRSLNNEVIACIEKAVLSRRIDPEALLAKAAQLRDQINAPPLNDDLLREAKKEGRP